VATTVDLSKSQTEAVLTQCLQAITDPLQAGEAVDLRGFGRFHLRHRQPRAGRNARTGATVQIPAKAVPTFTAGKSFQERVQSSAMPAGGAPGGPHAGIVLHLCWLIEVTEGAQILETHRSVYLDLREW